MSDIPGLDGILGVELIERTPDRVVAQWTIGSQHLQPFGIPHGGVYCTVHETAASVGGATWFGDRGHVVGASNTTDFLRQAKPADVITTTATPIHRGRTQQLWAVASADQDGRLIAHGQIRLANLEQAPPPLGNVPVMGAGGTE